MLLSPIGYITCIRNEVVERELSKFNEYLQNPSCIINPDIRNIFNQALIYYGGQYCIDLNLSREYGDHSTSIKFIDKESNTFINLEGMPDFYANINEILLSDLVKTFNPAINYTILLTSCREMDNLQKKIDKYLLIFYEQITKILNLYITYDNLKPEDKSQQSLDNYIKECKKSIVSISNNNVFQLQYFNNNNINNNTHNIAISSREKPVITGKDVTNFIFNKIQYLTLNELKTFINDNKIKPYTDDEKKIIFGQLFKLFIININVIIDRNTVTPVNIDNINILKFIFDNNYTFLFEYIIYCLLNINIYRYKSNKSNKYLNDNKSKQSLLKLFIKIIPELKDIPEIKTLTIENQSLDELSKNIIDKYIR